MLSANTSLAFVGVLVAVTMIGFIGFGELVTETVELLCGNAPVLSVIAAPQRRATRVLLLNCCFMMNFLPSNHLANFPVSWVEQNFTF